MEFGALTAAFTLGLRHGWDWDHVAAITDITSSQTGDDATRRSMVFSTLYIVGHAVVVTALGVIAIAAGSTIPGWLDGAMGRVIGATLLALGVYVIVSLIRHGRDARMRSRWMLAFAGARKAVAWARRRGGWVPEPVVVEHDHEHEPETPHHDPTGDAPAVTEAEEPADLAVRTRHRHRHAHVGSLPDDPFVEYGRGTSFLVGMLHGVGAETPTQMVLFASAAGAASAWVGSSFLVAFVVGLMISNTAVAFASRLGALNAERNFAAFATVSVVVAGLSLYLGTVYLFDLGDGLPGLFT